MLGGHQVPASEFGFYEWSGSTIEYHRNQIRTHLGFRTRTTADATEATVWLAENVAHAERRPERVREEILKHLREERIEPPTPGRIPRTVASALPGTSAPQARQALIQRLDELIGQAQADGAMRSDVGTGDLMELLNVFACHPGVIPERFLPLILDGLDRHQPCRRSR